MRFQFIGDHRAELSVNRMCEVLKVSRSGYYAWRTRPASEREMANQEILREIRTVHRESDQTYGSPRI
jgi:putative transposase